MLKIKDMYIISRLVRSVFLTLFFCFCLYIHGIAMAQTITPLQYGLIEAQSPEEVYRVLFRTHQAADSMGCSVSYDGIDTLRVAIPPDAQSIPLQSDNDFAKVVFIVANNTRNIFLFQYTPFAYPVHVNDTMALCTAIDSGDFRNMPMFADGDWLLHIVDSTPWVDRRRDHDYGHYREDIMLIHDGISHDKPAMPYSAGGSRPSLIARRLDSITPFSFSNITLVREDSSLCATYLLQLENLPQATIRNVVVVTPRSKDLAANDAIIYIYNSANVTIDSLTIWGTYSRLNHSGYGLLLGNLRNTHIRRLKALTDWGVFGTNNMTETTIEYSEFNRFDIHCYGRNVTFDHCLQRNGYNQFSSVYGTIAFHSCTFDDFTPVLIEDTYNAYSHFLLSMDSCRWWPTAKRHVVFDGGHIDSPLNSREELQIPSLPDIDIDNLDIYTTKNIGQVELFHMKGSERHAHIHQGLSRIALRNVTLRGNPNTKIILSNKRVNLLREASVETFGSMQDTTLISRLGSSVVDIK